MPQNWFTNKEGQIIQYDSIEKFPENCIGFVYKITNIRSGKFYIGKKSLWSNQKKALTKKELAEQSGPGRKPTKKLVTKETNWLDYWGSNKGLLGEIQEQGVDVYHREILKFCYSKKELTYWEVHFQCVEGVLLSELSYNDNILAKFFRRDLTFQK
jgi:hypothetical protein